MDELFAINRELEVPTPAEFGISRTQFFENLNMKAQQALASGSPANNPRVPDADSIIEIYKQLW